jgi:amidohydrolase
MHACGHDVHTAALLGAIRILQALRAHWEGTIKCLFQPGEELLPGGASLMIKAGALENPRPTAIVGQHVAPDIPVGKVGFKSGMYMASADELYLTVKGKGGHGAMPHLAVDPVLVAAHIITALQQITSRNAHPALPTVLTLGKIQSKGGATNIIPEEVLIEGTFRTFDEDWRQEAHERMQKIVAGVAEGMGATCDFRIERGYPVLHNHETLTQRARQAAIELLGAEQVIELPIRMTSEDFAWYTHVIPGCFYRLGTRNESKGIVSGVHTPTFDIDETALQTGMALMAWFAIRDIF